MILSILLNALRPNADHFQIFSEDRGAASPRPIMRRSESFKFLTKTLRAVVVEGRNLLIEWPVVQAEELHHFRGGETDN